MGTIGYDSLYGCVIRALNRIPEGIRMSVLKVLVIAMYLSAVLILIYPVYFLDYFGTNQDLPFWPYFGSTR